MYDTKGRGGGGIGVLRDFIEVVGCVHNLGGCGGFSRDSLIGVVVHNRRACEGVCP